MGLLCHMVFLANGVHLFQRLPHAEVIFGISQCFRSTFISQVEGAQLLPCLAMPRPANPLCLKLVTAFPAVSWGTLWKRCKPPSGWSLPDSCHWWRQLCRERTTVTCVRMALFCSNLLSTKSSQTTRDFQLYVVLQQISWCFLFIGNAGLPTVCFFCTTVHSKFSRTCWDAERKLRQFCEAFGRSQERIYPKFPYDLIAIEVHPRFYRCSCFVSQYIPIYPHEILGICCLNTISSWLNHHISILYAHVDRVVRPRLWAAGIWACW